MSTRVLCPTCLREETWSDGDREVHQPGGSRQPAVPPMLAAWDTLRAARAEGRAARGVCVCGQPLVDDGEADAAHPPIPRTLTQISRRRQGGIMGECCTTSVRHD